MYILFDDGREFIHKKSEFDMLVNTLKTKHGNYFQYYKERIKRFFIPKR